MNALVNATQSQIFAPSLPPLIERLVSFEELIPGFLFPKFSYSTRYDLCAGLKEGDWEALTDREKGDLKHYYSLVDCPAVTEKLVPKVSEAIQEVAKKMLVPDSDLFSVGKISKDGLLGVNVFNQISMDSEFAFALNGWESVYSRQEALGSVGHAIAHRILRHVERIFTRILEGNGIQVPSEDDALEFLRARATGFTQLPESESGRRIVRSFLKIAGKRNPEIVLQGMAAAAERNNPALSFSRLNHEIQQEADLYTMIHPDIARGLRDSIVRDIETSEAKCAQDLSLDCSSLYNDSDAHPALVSRREYLTGALCRIYPKENQDICPEAHLGYWTHARARVAPEFAAS